MMAKCPLVLEKTLLKLEMLSSSESYKHFRNIVAIDLNFGCPSPAVIREGAGPALLKRNKRIFELLSVLVSWKRNCSLPNVGAVGCKIRLGLNKEEVSNKIYMNVVDAANRAGIDYMVVHARHAQQRSSHPADWDKIREVKEAADLPIIGNGDVNGLADAERMMELTGCDGIMIARAAIRNPWVFRQFSSYRDTPGMYEPTVDEVVAAKREYTNWSAICGTKAKYSLFHQNNFERLESSAKSGMFMSRVLNARIPKNTHIT